MTNLSESILRLRAEGKTYAEIQEELDCSKGSISYHLGLNQKDKKSQRQVRLRSQIYAFVQGVKEASPCSDCGGMFPYWVMDFDHCRGDKSADISRLVRVTTSLASIKEEIEKCDLVCANCHRTRTHLRHLGI